MGSAGAPVGRAELTVMLGDAVVPEPPRLQMLDAWDSAGQLERFVLIVAGRSSPNNLYDEGIATMEGGGSYNQTDAEGFLRIQGLPGRVQARVWPREY